MVNGTLLPPSTRPSRGMPIGRSPSRNFKPRDPLLSTGTEGTPGVLDRRNVPSPDTISFPRS